jgi:hypothetical protein
VSKAALTQDGDAISPRVKEIAAPSRKGRGGLGRCEFGLPEGHKMFRTALFENGYRHAMFGDARRGKVNQNPPPKMSRIYREDRSMGVVVHKRTFLAQVCLTIA